MSDSDEKVRMSSVAIRRSGPPLSLDVVQSAVWSPGADRTRGDHDLNPDDRAVAPAPKNLRAAAVLCALSPRPTGLHVILTRRADHLKRHAGQIAFPGGKIDAGDASPLAAALREAEEEIGLPREQVDVLGPIDKYETGTGFLVTPFVGVAHPAFAPLTDDGEVAEVFEAPLDFLMDPANRRTRFFEREGRRRWFYVYEWGDRVIWGATAGMLSALSERIAAARGLDRGRCP